MVDLDSLLLIGAVVTLVAIISSRIGAGLGLPSLLLFLGLGMGLGSAGLGINFNDADLAHSLGFAALVLILTEGGLTTKWVEIKGSLPTAGLLATLGIGVSIITVFLFAHLVLGFSPWVAVLLGAVLAPTDSAAVFSVLRHVPLPARVRSVLEAESGLNDAPTVLMVAMASSLAAGHPLAGGALGLGAMIVFEIVGGLFFGVVLGWIGVKVLRNIALPSTGLYPLATFTWAVLAYGVATGLHTSGFAAVYVCAVMLGNGNLPHRLASRSFAEGIGWIAQIGLFVMLGLLANPGTITLSHVLMALAIGAFLTFVARPLSVWICAVWFKIPVREQLFLSWAGLRGAVPIILATVPLVDRVPDAVPLFNIVLVFVVVSTFIQAPTLPRMAKLLGLQDSGPTDVETEVAPLEKLGADMLQVRIPEGSKLAGVEIVELRLPVNTVVSLIIRGDESFAPNSRTLLETGDTLLIVTPRHHLEYVERRFREVGQGGRLARWRRGLEPVADDLD